MPSTKGEPSRRRPKPTYESPHSNLTPIPTPRPTRDPSRRLQAAANLRRSSIVHANDVARQTSVITALKAVQFNSYFLRKPRSEQLRIVRTTPPLLPMARRLVAAFLIQKWYRSLPRERRTWRTRQRLYESQAVVEAYKEEMAETAQREIKYKRFRTHARMPTTTNVTEQQRPQPELWVHPYTKHLQTLNVYKKTFVPLLAQFAALRTETPMDYSDYCAVRIQRWWRQMMISKRRKYIVLPLYTIAAVSVQRWWRHVCRKISWKKRYATLHVPVRIIQTAYRRYSQRKVYVYLRNLIREQRMSDSLMVVRSLGNELSAADKASGLYVRFRLGGTVFPPLIYYKVYTKHHVTDIGAFAPRDYSLDQTRRVREGATTTDVNHWYKRWENNGWRHIGWTEMVNRYEHHDSIEESTHNKRIVYHPNKLVRRADAIAARKKKKIEWMTQLYSQAKQEQVQADMETNTLEEKESTTDEFGMIDEDDGVEELMSWVNALDFETYQREWQLTATTLPTDEYIN